MAIVIGISMENGEFLVSGFRFCLPAGLHTRSGSGFAYRPVSGLHTGRFPDLLTGPFSDLLTEPIFRICLPAGLRF